MNNELSFRLLNKEEIEARVASCNQYGASILLYKNARADQNILDETVGPFGWKREHSRDNANCTVSIWDDSKQQWISKEDTGVESNTEKEKGLASDSFKRACVNWGIGRELYSAPDIFIFKDHLPQLTGSDGKYKCYDKFVVTNIAYTERRTISAVEIGVLDKAKKNVIYKEVFRPYSGGPSTGASSSKADKTASAPTSVPTSASAASTTATKSPVLDPDAPLTDDEIILFGNCAKRRYGDVKDTATFKSFLNWVARTKTSYTDQATAVQFQRFLKLAQQSGTAS